jgi:methyl-accepting chemotaxis protein
VPVIREGKRVGLLAVNIKVDLITEFVNELSGNQQQVFVSRKDGYILVAQNPEMLGDNLFATRPSYNQFKDAQRTAHTYNFEGEDYFVASSKVDSLGWNVWSWDSVAVINSASSNNLRTTAIIALAFIILAVAIVYLLVNKLMYLPIGGEPSDIEKMVQKIADGDLSISTQTTGHETGVYQAVLKMVGHLKTTISDINDTTADVSQSSTQIEKSAQGVTSTAEEQMQKLEQTASAMNEMTVTVSEVARNAQQASTSANEAKEHSKGKLTLKTVKIESGDDFIILPSEIINIRKKFNMSQGVFAKYLHTSSRTLENWEQGRSCAQSRIRCYH